MTQEARRKQLWIRRYVSVLDNIVLISHAMQILRKNHTVVVYDYMQKRIDAHNTALTTAKSDPSITGNDLDDDGGVFHIQLGSSSNLLTLSLLEDLHRGDLAFRGLEAQVRAFIALAEPDFLPSPAHPIKVFNSLFWDLMFLNTMQGLQMWHAKGSI